jgi:DNA-directed RNA polymerase specialized sigma subunit
MIIPASKYQDVYAELLEAIASLEGNEAAVLQLYYVDSCSHTVIGKILKLSMDEVRSLYWSAIEKVKPQLSAFK